MLETDHVALIRIATLHSHGLYAKGPGGERIYVPFGEVSWRRLSDLVVAVGDEVRAKILGRNQVNEAYYVASIKQANPEQDPWRGPGAYRVGERVTGVVTGAGAFAFAQLPAGAIALIRNRGQHEVESGEEIDLLLVEVSSERRTAIAV